MSWYYAENNERRGPIEDGAFEELVRQGTIKPETLVWKEGMAEWAAYASVPGAMVPPTSAPPRFGDVKCSSCGGFFAQSEVITIGGRAICARCKPLAVRQMEEGANQGGATIDPARLLAEVKARGGYRIDVGSIISRAWEVVKANFWPCVGTTLLAYLLMVVSQNIPCIGILAPFFITGPIFGGLYLYFIKQIRREPAVVGDAFSGFNQPHFGQLALAGTVQTLVLIVVILLVAGPAMFAHFSSLSSGVAPSDEVPTGLLISMLILMLPVAYLTVAWLLSYAFIIDQKVPFWQAMELSRKLVNMNLGGWFVLMLVNFLLSMAGVLALCVGIIFVLPLFFCMLMVVYEDILRGPSTERLL